jgi:hypothetical protein
VILPKLYPTNIYRGGERAYFGGAFQDAVLHWPNVATYRIVEGKTIDIEPQTQQPDILQLYTEAKATGILLLQQGYYLLHASAVFINHKAHVFCGTPGAGKSTTTAAFVKAGHAPLADDMVVIWFDDAKKPYLIPQKEPKIKIWQDSAENLSFDPATLSPCFEGHNKFYYYFDGSYPNEPIPLGGIYILHRSNRFGQLQEVSPKNAVIELIKHFPLPKQLLYKDSYLQKHFVESLLIAHTTPIYRQKRPKNFEQLQKFVIEFCEYEGKVVI